MYTTQYPVLADFIKLHQLHLGEYVFVYRSEIVDSEDGKISNSEIQRYQFVGIENKNQELNLFYIDSTFPKLLAEVTRNVYEFKFECLNDFLEYKFNHLNTQAEFEQQLMKKRFLDFLHLLFYADLSNPKVNQIHFNNDKIYCSRNENVELVFYTIYELKTLLDRLMNHMKFHIHKVLQNENELVLHLKLIVDDSF